MMKKGLILLTVLAWAGNVNGANYYWIGDYAGTSGDNWNLTTPGHWSPDLATVSTVVPGASDLAIIHDQSLGPMPVIRTNIGTVNYVGPAWQPNTTASLTVETGGYVFVSTALRLGNGDGSHGILNIDGGTVVANILQAGDNGAGTGTGTAQINLNSGVFQVGSLGLHNANLDIEPGAILYVSGDVAGGSFLSDLITAGKLTANDGMGTIEYTYNTQTSLTEITALEQVSTDLSFSSNAATVQTTYVTLTGTSSSNIVRGLWYEVRAGSPVGPMVDYGALRAVTNWSITVRHLRLGDNFVAIYGKNQADATFMDTMTVTLESDFSKGSVRPRPNPSEVWFGGLSSDNPSLAYYPQQWPFVQKYIDGMMFHSFANGYWTGSSRSVLAALLENYNMRHIEEMGDVASNTNFTGVTPTTGWGAVVANREYWDIYLTDITHDYHPEFIQDFCQEHPEWSENAILEWFTGETYGAAPEETYPHGGWKKAFSDYHENFPYAKVSQTKSSVYLRWENYPVLNGAPDVLSFNPLRDDNGNIIYVGGNPVYFNYTLDDLLPRHIYSALDVGLKNYHYWTDFPWGWFGAWGDKASAAVNREKIRVYEQYLRENDAGHVMICNSAVDDPTLTPDAWDLRFKDESLKSLFLHQAEGGRAKKYVFESWYTYLVGEERYGRPYATVPEDKEGSYSNLAKDGIKYLKGIKDIGGTLEELNITIIKQDNNTYEVQVKNDGDIACLPVLLALESGSDQVNLTYYDMAGRDISTQIRSNEGYTYHEDFSIYQTESINDKLLQPGESFSVFAIWDFETLGVTHVNKTVAFESFWNPQDPTGIIRDKKIIDIPSCSDVLSVSGSTLINPLLQMDLTGQAGIPDCYVDSYDLQELSIYWLDSYNLGELALLAQDWLDCNDPSDANCQWPF